MISLCIEIVSKALEYAKTTRSKSEDRTNDMDDNESKKLVKNQNEEKKRDETATIVRKPLSSDRQKTLKILTNTEKITNDLKESKRIELNFR